MPKAPERASFHLGDEPDAVRMAMDIFEFSPPLIATREDIDRIFDTVRAVIRERA